jgi:hypothetical protein
VRREECYPDPAEAVARKVTVTLKVPAGFSIPGRNSPPATLVLGDLKPGERRVADWWVAVGERGREAPAGEFTVTGQAEGSPATVVALTEDTAIPCGQTHEVRASDMEWLEVAYRQAQDRTQPTILLDCLNGPVRDPSVSDGSVTVRYEGALETGDYLVLDAAKGSRLFSHPLVEEKGEARADAADPSGFRCFSEGYLVVNLQVRRPVKGGQSLKVTITGKAADEGQSLVVCRFKAKGEDRDVGLLANGFAAEWGAASETLTVPEGADTLQAVYMYRFKQVGKVWYGPVTIESGDVGPEGKDVSDRVRGSFPVLQRDELNVIRYTDAEAPNGGARMKVRVGG